ncbi:NAD(P)-binding protein [Canariomyces notabilis]|uniref:NAD(P)-binding protein n=1 Tax=Canariomyces notabilis TaxID=2074819 RepID=A0AAN6YTR9_9PEZI|nr:NAD(P)-binding protein [Canariomyces arenarius]
MTDQKVAIVTGAASGIGKALAVRLVEKGWLVALLDINEEAGSQLASSLGPNTIFLPTDVASYTSQSTAFSAVFSRFGRIDALCANAGIVDRCSLYLQSHRPESVTDIPPAPDLTATDIDFKGVVYGVYLATHFMRFNPPTAYGKKIVVTASVVGTVPYPALPEYSAAKSAVVGFVRATAPVLRQKEGIALSAVCPHFVATPMLPPFLVDAVGDTRLISVDEVVKAYEVYLDQPGDRYAGEVGEVVGGSSEVVPLPTYGTEQARESMVAGIEPIFEAVHGGPSGVDAQHLF